MNFFNFRGSGLFLATLVCVNFARPSTAAAPAGQNPSAAPRQEYQAVFAAVAQAFAAGDFKTARAECAKILGAAEAPPHYRSYAHLRLAQSYQAENNLAAARAEYAKIQADEAYPEVHRYEAGECVKEIERVARGLPARDPAASRTQIPPIGKFTTELFVAPTGSDAHPGTKGQPFASLEKARDTIRALKAKGGLAGPVCVWLAPGEYRVTGTFELTEADSGTAQKPIVYRAEKPGASVLYGGMKISGFTPVTDAAILERLPFEARGRVRQCDLKKQGVTDFSPLTERGYGAPTPRSTLELFFNGEPLTLARWPNAGFVNGGKIVEPGSKAAGKPSIFEYLDDRHARWTKAEDAWLFGYFRHGWADRTLKIHKIDPITRQLACGPYQQGDESMEPVKWFNKGRIKYFAFNLLEELDQPGEWYLDRQSGRLYLYPPADPAKATVEIGLLSVPMLTMAKVSHVRLEGLVFDLSRAGCMTLKDCTHCLVAGCTIKRFAATGIAIQGGQANGILSCDLFSLGRGATEVSGGDRKTLTPARHFVENCHMYALGRLDHTYVPGIRMNGVGIRAAHNDFHDCPSSAIRFDGNDLLMEFNRVERVILESEDQGGMETFGNPTFRGNVLRYNSFAFIGAGAPMEGSAGRAGIRLDDAISGTLVYGNLFFQAAQSFGGINLNGGRDNIMDNNVFAVCEKGITGGFNPKNKMWARLAARSDPSHILSDLYLSRYPELKHALAQPAVNHVWRSVFWNCGPTFSTYGKPTREHLDLLENVETRQEDLGFVDAAKGDLRLKPDAPLLKRIGFRPIPVDEIGLYRDPYRLSLPVKARAK